MISRSVETNIVFPPLFCVGRRLFGAQISPMDRAPLHAGNPKRHLSQSGIWRFKCRRSISKCEKIKAIQYNLMASCLSQLHTDPRFCVTLFSPLGLKSGSGAVSICGARVGPANQVKAQRPLAWQMDATKAKVTTEGA